MVYVDAFYMDVYAVSNAQYKRFVDATGYPAVPLYWDDPNFNVPNQPVVGVDWYDAKAYCHGRGNACRQRRSGKRRRMEG